MPSKSDRRIGADRRCIRSRGRDSLKGHSEDLTGKDGATVNVATRAPVPTTHNDLKACRAEGLKPLD